MRKLLEIARRTAPDQPEYRQTFVFETDDGQATVATALRELNSRPQLVDIDGDPALPIRWECSCLQKKCGACAMVINGVPRVACDARLVKLRGERITLEPLRKFPVIADLMVDRDAIFDRLGELETFLDDEVELPTHRNASEAAYEASRCLQCGCCLEVCPNFSTQGAFGGMSAMAPLARLLAETPKGAPGRKALATSYKQAVYAGCGKSLACRSICPAGIDIARLMSRSNAAAVWGLR